MEEKIDTLAGRRFLTVKELALVTGLSKRSLWGWIHDGRLAAIELPDKFFVDIRDLGRLLKEVEDSER